MAGFFKLVPPLHRRCVGTSVRTGPSFAEGVLEGGLVAAVRAHEQLGAVEAHAAEDLEHHAHKANVHHRLGQLDVPKVSGAVDVVAALRVLFFKIDKGNILHK